MIKTLDPKQQPVTASPEIQALKNQLSEKERKIQHMEVKTSDRKRNLCSFYHLEIQHSLMTCFFSNSMITRRAEPDTTRRRSSSSAPGTTWWVSEDPEELRKVSWIQTWRSNLGLLKQTPHVSFLSFLFQGMAFHQKVSGERLGPSNQAMSFLAQQRQSTNARRGLIRQQPR